MPRLPGALISPGVKPHSMVAECDRIRIRHEQITHSSASAFLDCFSLGWVHSWSQCSGTTVGVSFPDISGVHFNSAIELIPQHHSWVKVWRLDNWPVLVTNQETSSYQTVGCRSQFVQQQEPHIFITYYGSLELSTSSWNCTLILSMSKGSPFHLYMNFHFKNFWIRYSQHTAYGVACFARAVKK